MGDYLTFSGAIEAMPWGKNTYTILRVPSDVEMALRAQNARRVEGEINDHPFNLKLSQSPRIDGAFFWTGKTLLEELGVVPGELLDVRLRPVSDDIVDVPADVVLGLTKAGALDAWQALNAGIFTKSKPQSVQRRGRSGFANWHPT